MESRSRGVVVERFGLKADDLAETEAVLCDHGNCSSATVLLVLDEIRRGRDLNDGACRTPLSRLPRRIA